MATIADLRAAVGASSNRMSDEELLAAYARGANMSPNQAAMEFGWNPSTSGQWGNRASAAVDTYQSNLFGIGEALGSDWARRKRVENEFAANVSRDRAAAQGAISSFKDIGGVGDFFNYAGGLAVDSAPYLGEALVGGGVGGLAARGLGLAGRAAARTAGAVGASYPSAVGDVLSSQREQAGTTDLGAAAALGVPYALANAFGIEGALARGATMKSGIEALDNMTGLRGGLARTAASAGKGVLQEAPSETFQEAMNQFGRMAVDPNETFFNERSNERFLESAVGGGVLGGLFGGGMGGWRRSDQYYRDQQAALPARQQQQQQQESVSLLAPEVPKVGEQFSLFGSPYTNADSDVSTPAPRALEDLLAEQAQVRAETMDVLRQKNAAEAWFHGRAGELQNAAAPNESGQRWEEMASQFNRRLSELQAQSVSIEAQLEPYQRSMAFADQGGQMGLDFTRPQFPQTVSLLEWNQKREEPLLVMPNGQAVSQEQFAAFPPVVQSYLLALRQPRTRPMGLSGPTLPGVINVNPYGQAGATETQNQTLLADTTDLGTELARQRIEQGFVGEPATKQTGKAPSGTVVAAPAAKAQKEEAAWPNRPLWTQYALPAKSTEAGRTVFDQAVQAKNNGTLDAEGFERVVEGLRKHTNSGRAVLAAETSRVAGEKEQAGKPSAAPKAPKQPAVIVQPQGASNAVSVPGAAAVDVRQQSGNGQAVGVGNPTGQAAGENQLLVQGQTQGAPAQQAGAVAPNVSVPNLAGQPTGRGSDAGGAVAGGSVASAGSNPVATVGGADPARGVAPNDGPATTVADGGTQGVSTAVAVSSGKKKSNTISERLKTAAKTAVEVGVVNFRMLKQALEPEDPRMHHAVRLTLGVDKDGDRLDKPLSVEAAAERAGLGKNRSELSKVLSALGLTRDVRNRFVNSTAQANERAEGNIGEDTDISQLQAEYIDESEATGARRVAESDNVGAGAAAEDFGRAGEQQSAGGISSVGGSQGRTNSGKNLPLLTNRKAYQVVREKGLEGLSDAEMATLIADAEPYADSTRPEDQAALRAIWSVAVKRQNKPGFNALVNAAFNRRQGLTATKQSATKASESNVIETDEQGEPLVTLSKQEQTLLIEATNNLTQEEQTALEDHYGGSLESPEVQGKVANHVVAHMDGKKPKLPEVIRKIIAKLAKALAAVAVFFNVGGMNPQISSDAYARTVASMPAQVTVTQAEQRESKKADTAGRKLSPNAQRVADWIAENAEANEISQIVDPATGMMYVMKGGKIVADSPALFGKAGIGAIDAQIIGNPAANMTDADKVTPAGRFSLKLEEDEKYGSTLTFLPTNDGGGYAIHRVYLGDPAERRTERLNSKNAADNTVSYGCVNVSDAFYDEVLKKFDYSGKAFAYLLPSDPSKLGQFFDLSNQNRTPAPTRTASSGQKFGTRRSRGGATYSKTELEDEIKSFVRVGALGRSINIVESLDDLLNSPLDDIRAIGEALRDPGKYGVFANNSVWMIANRIERGNGRAAFMHEVGVHLGLERLLPQATFDSLVDKVVEWADKNDGSQASKIARAAIARVPPSTPDEDVRSEVLAYFVEEAIKAGIDPTATKAQANSPIHQWMSQLLSAFKAALVRLGVKPDAFTAQDMVDLAFGAARLEVDEGSAPAKGEADTKFGSNTTGSYDSTRARFDALNKALPPSARTATSNIATIIKTAMSGIANRVVFTHDLLERAARVGLASAADFGRLYKERAQMTNGLSGRVDDVARLYSEVPDAERGRGPGTVNDFLKDSTRTDAWGFVPDWLPEDKRSSVKVDPAMAKRFAALSPQSQAYARAVFEHGYKTLELKKRTILNATVSEYNALIKAAKDAGDEDEVARLESDKSKAQTKFDSLFKTMGESPYAPLKRFGNWVVIAESKALRQARLDDDKKRIAELEQDGKHYYVDFFESQMEALNAERQLRGLGAYDAGVDGVVVRKKEEARERLYGGDGMAAAFTKLRNQARMRLEGEQDVSKRALLEMATDMYLSALAESSARKSEMRRRGIEGDIDMLRSFVAQGYADAHMVSALAFSGKQGDAINAMRNEKETGSSAEQTRKSQAFNEIVKRHADSMEYVEPNAIDGIKTAASIYYLAFSPAYYLQNLTQPWMVSLPVIAGKHDYGKTAAAIGKAGSELKDAWLGSGLSQAIDLSKVPADVREAMTTLYERGVLTSGLNLEFKNARASDATGAYGRTKQALGDVKDFINDVQTKVEVMNRTATAMAAYRLELSKGATPDQALKYADDIVRQTHGDYSMMAAPRFFNSNFGKLALQFRKYQLLQLSLMARLIRESFTGTDRKAAAKALGFVLGQTGLLAGAMGLPGFTAIAWILSKLFGDPDEPDDPEYQLRRAIGDKDTADLILKGLPARFGADLSGKIGWQNMLSVLPYTDIDMTKKSVTEIGFALTTGPAGAMAGKVVDGMASMKDGRYVEGLTKALPTGFGNAIKGANTFLDGVRNKDGELLLSPDEINMAEAVLMGIGLTPTQISAQSFRQRVNYEATTNFADRAAKIKQQFVEAAREGSGRQEAIDAWMKLQDVRVANGFKRQPMQDLYDAVKESRKQERNTLNGVQFRDTNRPFVERLGQI